MTILLKYISKTNVNDMFKWNAIDNGVIKNGRIY